MKTILLSFLLLVSTIGSANTHEKLARILKSGDGKSPETAYKVYSTSEEYQLLIFLEKTPSSQALKRLDNKLFDVFQVEGEMIWFTIIKKPDGIIIS